MAQTTSATWQSITSGDHWYETKLSIFSDNLLDASEISEYGYGISVSDGSVISQSAYYATGYIPVIPGYVYYIGCNFNGATAVGLAWYDSDKTFISSLPNGTMLYMDHLATAPSGARYLRFTISNSANPGYMDAVFVREYGRNLFNPDTVGEAGYYINPNNGYLPSGSTDYRPSDFMPVEPGYAYYFGTRSLSGDAGLAWYDENKTYISGVTLAQLTTDGNREISPPNAKYLRWTIYTSVNTDWQYMSYVCKGNPNLFNKDTVADENKFINATNGNTQTPSNPTSDVWRHSDYIPVTGGVEYYFGHVNATATYAGIAWYNSNKIYISGINDTNLSSASNLITAPSNAAFIRISFRIGAWYNPKWQSTVYLLSLETPVRHAYRLDFGEDKVYSISTGNALWTDKPTIGSCPAGEISFSVMYDNEEIVRMAKCVPYVRACSTSQQSEWLQKGEYYIDERSITKYNTGINALNVHGYDAMLKAEEDFPSSGLEWPATDTDVIAECASAMGVNTDSRNSNYLTQAFSISLPAGFSMREILSYIAAMYGGSFVISDAGELRFVPFVGSTTTFSLAQDAKQLDYAPALPAYTRVIFNIDENTQVSSGNDIGGTIECDCPIATQATADYALSQINTLEYQPMTASGVLIPPEAEIADWVTIDGITSVMAGVSTSFGRLMFADIAAPLEQEVTHEYQYVSPTERKYRRELGDMASSITLNSQQIELKVNAGDIISTINQSAEAVTINANKINLNGSVTVGTADSQSIMTIEGPTQKTVIFPAGVRIYNKENNATNKNCNSLFNPTGWFMLYPNGKPMVKVWPGWFVFADSTGTERVVLSKEGLQFYDQNGNPLNNYPAQTALSKYWKVTDTGWRVRSTPDSSTSANIIGTATNGATYDYIGEDNGWVNIKFSSTYTSAYIGQGSGELIYQ